MVIVVSLIAFSYRDVFDKTPVVLYSRRRALPKLIGNSVIISVILHNSYYSLK
jgi:hypothetical protein